MKRRAILLGLAALAMKVAGCGGDSLPPPPQGDPRASWPDEVKEAEAAFEKKAAEKAKKGR
jgi:hypothetical protein